MLRDRVAAYYRSRGYRVEQNARITGVSGATHAVDVWAEGNLGNLAVFLGDDGGIEGPELVAMRRTARDLGATAVVAPERDDPRLRALATQAGIVVFDPDQMRRPAARVPDPVWQGEDPAWPSPGDRRDEPAVPWPKQSRNPVHDVEAGVRREAGAHGSRSEPGSPPTPARPATPPAPEQPRRSLSDQILDKFSADATAAPEPRAAAPGTLRVAPPPGAFTWLRPETATRSGFAWLRPPAPRAEDASLPPAGEDSDEPAHEPGPPPRPEGDAEDDGRGKWHVEPDRVDQVIAGRQRGAPSRAASVLTEPVDAEDPPARAAPVEMSIAQPEPRADPEPVPQATQPAVPRQPTAAERAIGVALWVVAGLLVVLVALGLFVF